MKPGNRLLYLDWVRGLAAVVMLQGHVFHSFMRDDLRNGGPYVFSQFVGGMPPAIFLFLTGVTLSFLMDSLERKGVTPGARWYGSLKRARYLFIMAFLFRIQLWAFTRFFGSDNPWTEMLKVDILNCMGLGIAALSFLALFPSRHRVTAGALTGVLIAGVSPLISAIAAHWPWALHAYFAPSYDYFSFFPWAAFIAFGVSFGSMVRTTKEERLSKAMQNLALGGIGLAFSANWFSSFEPKVLSGAEFWLNAPSLVLMKLGVVLMLIAFAYVWLSQKSAQGWSWIRLLGTSSLLVYWIHIELVYGHWLGSLKNNLTVSQTVAVASAMICLMVALAYVKTNWNNIGPAISDQIRMLFSPPVPQPRAQRVSGD